ncbi:MAG: FkbM family methyltransferase [Cyanophyceae cyanobacterium]
MTPTYVRKLGKLILRPGYRQHQFVKSKLKNIPRYTPASVNLLGKSFGFVDSASFLFMHKEIFEQQIYKFRKTKEEPLIIDCGANIGLSVLYFKQLFPESRVIAFEPDVKVFQVLQKNVDEFQLSNVELIDKAVWSSETTLEFMAEGADGGRVTQIESKHEKYQVKTVRLRDYLYQPVDLLKLDIEGAETEVIQDCQDLLVNVENFFIEYHSFVNEPQTLHMIINILSSAGYRLHIHPPATSPQPFYHRNVHLGMDMQLNIFAFRE